MLRQNALCFLSLGPVLATAAWSLECYDEVSSRCHGCSRHNLQRLRGASNATTVLVLVLIVVFRTCNGCVEPRMLRLRTGLDEISLLVAPCNGCVEPRMLRLVRAPVLGP